MSMMKSIVAMVAVGLLTGCATTTHAPAAAPDSATSTAVFIRERAEPTAFNVSVQLDGKKMASISNRSFAEFAVKPGKHAFKIDWPALAGQLDLEGEIDFRESEKSYFLITGDFEMAGMSYKAIKYNTTVALIPLAPAEADRILRRISAQ